MRVCVIDFETSSACDLRAAGAWRYSEDPTTEIICLAFAEDQTQPFVWVPGDDTFVLQTLVEDDSVTFIAHNVGFEKAIWRNIMMPVFDFPDIPDHRWHDTMAVAAMKVIPQQLERAASALSLPLQKDMDGSRLTRSLSKPNKKTGAYDRSPETLARVYAYCQQDVRAEFALHERLGWQQKGERRVWLLDQTINQRGVQLDLEYIAAARKIVAEASAPLAEEFRGLTGGVEFTQRDKFLGWLHGRGVPLENLQKATVTEALGLDEEDDDGDLIERDEDAHGWGMPEDARRALYIRHLIGSASVKKLGRMEACAASDGRAHGLLQYHGAGPGRWAGRIIQPQNFPRGTIEIGDKPPEIDWLVGAILTGDYQYVETVVGPAVETVVSGLRHALIAAPGCQLVAGDFAQVEARVLLALAGQHDKTALLAAKEDPYCDMASTIYRRPITKADKPERQVGKNSVLGLGFQMGAAKFRDKYGQGQDEAFFKEVVRVYREDWAPLVPDVWYGLERAACRAVWDKRPVEAYGVLYSHEGEWLTARLPSGRKLYYYKPEACRKAMPWDPNDVRPAWTYWAQKMGRWKKIDAYGGLMTENVVQGLARDLLVSAMFKAEDEGFPIVLTVHDELVAEPLQSRADAAIAIQQLMEDIPDWARAMQVPIASEVWAGDRYRK